MDTQQQKKFNILLIGDDCLDVYQYGTVDRISPEAPVPVFKYSHSEEKPGMAHNVLLNLKALGCDVKYLHAKTSTKVRLIDIHSKQHIVRIDDDQTSDPIEVDLNDVQFYDAVVVSDYLKGTVTTELIENLIATGVPVFVDTKKQDLGTFNGAWVKINETEHSKIKTKCDQLIVTQGGRGAMLVSQGILIPGRKVEVVDVTGAGDTFLAALCYKFLESRDIVNSISFANRAASITVQHVGCYAPRLEEIK